MNQVRLNRQFFSDVWKLTRGYWNSGERWKARGLLAVVITLSFGLVYLTVLLNQWNNDFYNALQNYDEEQFWPLIRNFTVIAFTYIAVAVYSLYLQQMLQIRWRTWMTKQYLQRWTGGQTYYKMQLLGERTDNPDQRISEDIRDFVEYTLALFLSFLQQTTTLAAFIVVLWNLSGVIAVPMGGSDFKIHGYMVWLCLVYASLGTFLAFNIGKPLVFLNFDQQRYEADFRFGLIRYRENAENIAFYRGEKAETKHIWNWFTHVAGNYFSLMRYQKRLSWFVNGYGQTAIIVPVLLVAPQYFAGQIMLGGVIQALMAFGKVQDALSFFVDRYATIAKWQAIVNRLLSFGLHMKNVEEILDERKFSPAEPAAFFVRNVNVSLPSGRALLKGLAFELQPGERLLITGPSGCGKSTLMRTVSGIWPYSSGVVGLPDGKASLFLPQRPYLPLGTLQQALLYPGRGVVKKEELEKVMRACKIGNLLDLLEHEDDWSRVLSLGEQQRIAFARVLLTKPDVLFMDESTSALDEDTEKALYLLVQQQLPHTALVSIGHRSSLYPFHNRQLQLDGNGNWKLNVLS